MLAEDSLPVIEIKADRTMIYPQRMNLTGEETLMDILQMMPGLMIVGYEDVISDYSLRIDNSPMNGDTRLILSQMKAKDIARIQVCDNTGVAKGSSQGYCQDSGLRQYRRGQGLHRHGQSAGYQHGDA